MSRIVRVAGPTEGALAALAEALRVASFGIEAAADDGTPVVLVTLAHTADNAIAHATAFAQEAAAGSGDRLVVNIWAAPQTPEWEARRQAATLAAFTRHAAQSWAARRVRVNGVTVEAAPASGTCAADVTAAIEAMWRWRSMTGQVIHLGDAPDWPAFLPQGGLTAAQVRA